MNTPNIDSVWDNFFSLKSVRELNTFVTDLDSDAPTHAALKYYINTWSDLIYDEGDRPFNPTDYLSLDRSAVMYGACPVIFEGTNSWASKPYQSRSYLTHKLDSFTSLIADIRAKFPSKSISLVVIPEKDYLISLYLLKESRFRNIREALYIFFGTLNRLNVNYIFDGPISGAATYQTLKDFEYVDSHLAGRNYTSIFENVLQSFGSKGVNIADYITFPKTNLYGDLGRKFGAASNGLISTSWPYIEHSSVELKAGSETFENPLGNTWQRFENASATINGSICILGDSHASVYGERRLTYLMSSMYRECVFYWNPCGVRGDLGDIEQDHILLEISLRFMV